MNYTLGLSKHALGLSQHAAIAVFWRSDRMRLLTLRQLRYPFLSFVKADGLMREFSPRR